MSQSGSYNAGGGGGGTVTTLTGNTGGPVSPTAGNIDVVGSGTLTVTGNPGTSTLTISQSGTVATSYDTDSGTATPSAGVLDILGGSNINTSGATNVVTINLDDTVSISGHMTAGTGFTATTGDVDIDAGSINLPFTNNGGTQGIVYWNTLPYLHTYGGTSNYFGQNAGNTSSGGGGNVGIGTNALTLNSGGNNVAVGSASGQNITSGQNNTAIGSNSLSSIATGTFNTAIGHNAGSAYNGGELFNIVIANNGVPGENQKIRIGDNANQISTYIAGIYGVTPANSPQMATIGSDGEMGSATLPTGGIDTLDGDTGSATGSTVTIAGGSNITTSAASSTVTVDLDNTVSISGSMTAGTGLTATTNGLTVTSGVINLPATSSATNGVINMDGARYIHSYPATSDFNTFVGRSAGNFTMTTTLAQGEVGVGTNTLQALTTGARNTAVGLSAGSQVTSGNDNVFVGYLAGFSHTTSDSNNLLIGSNVMGTAGVSNRIRIGNGSHTSCYLNGTYGVTPSISPQMATIGSDGQMGSQAIPGGGGISTLDGDTGSATGATVTIAGGSNITTSAASATVTVDLDSTVSISGSMTAGTGFTATTGDVTVSAGNIALPNTNLAGTHGVLTIGGFPFLSSDGNSAQSTFVGQLAGNFNAGGGDVAAGFSALANNVTGGQNVAVGFEALAASTGSGTSTAIGYGALASIDAGMDNIAIGKGAGGNYTTTESENILIGNVGVIGDIGVIRIGENGTQASAFLQGAYGITPANSPLMMTVGSDGELGSQAIPGGGGLTWSEQTGTTQAMAVSHGYILNNAGLVTATLPATAAVGDLMEIVGKGAGGWLLAQNSGQTVHFGNMNTTTGVGGSLASTNRYDCLSIICTTANTDFVIKSSIGNITVV